MSALGRRSPLWQGDVLHFADLNLDHSTMGVEQRQTRIKLSLREIQLLEYFLRHPRQVLTREQFEQTLWEWRTEPESNQVMTLIRRLPNRLTQIHATDGIEKIDGLGYRFKPPDRK